MPNETADILQSSQIGIEGTKGTAVAANKILKSVSITPKPVEPTEMLSARGSKIDEAQTKSKGAMTTAPIEGYQSFNDMIYLYYALLGLPTITDNTTHRVFTWLMKARDYDDIRTLTVENGGDNGVNRFAYGNITDLELSWSRTNAGLSGTMIGQLLAEEGVTPTTSGVTTVANVPVSPDLMDFYAHSVLSELDADPADYLLTDFIEGNLQIGDRRSPFFPLRSDMKSYKGTVEKKNTLTAHLDVQHNSQSDAMMRQLRNTLSRYYMVRCTGPEIVTGVNYLAEYTIPFKVNNPDRGEKDEVYGGMYDLQAVDDATLAGFLRVRIISPLASSAFSAATNLSSGQQPGELIQESTEAVPEEP